MYPLYVVKKPKKIDNLLDLQKKQKVKIPNPKSRKIVAFTMLAVDACAFIGTATSLVYRSKYSKEYSDAKEKSKIEFENGCTIEEYQKLVSKANGYSDNKRTSEKNSYILGAIGIALLPTPLYLLIKKVSPKSRVNITLYSNPLTNTYSMQLIKKGVF